MHWNFRIKLGIRLVQPPHELDLHNDYAFRDLSYSVAERTVLLQWQRSNREGVPASLPAAMEIAFGAVTEFRYQPRDPKLPFTEDDCLKDFGCWVDEPWCEGVMLCEQPDSPEEFTALSFMSGALVLIKADSAHATITA